MLAGGIIPDSVAPAGSTTHHAGHARRLARGFPLLLAGHLLLGIVVMAAITNLPDQGLQARVLGTVRASAWLTIPSGSLPAGGLAGSLGLRATLGLAARRPPADHASPPSSCPPSEASSDRAELAADSFNTGTARPCWDGGMNAPDIDTATTFIATHARVLDQRRFERLFGGGGPAPVRDAVAAYRNADGGFGHALEPDLRDPASQPAATEMAFRLLDETDSWDDDLVRSGCDWLSAVEPGGGGATTVMPSVVRWQHAPWWVPQDPAPVSLIQTGMITGTLHARGVRHPWLERATETMWERLADVGEIGAYDMFGILRFLEHVPDRDRATAVFERVGPLILSRNLVVLDPEAPGEVHSPLDFAPTPDSMARPLFEKRVIDQHLDHLARGQREDGGWMFNWPAWSPAAERDWRGFLTVDSLTTLRANGRL